MKKKGGFGLVYQDVMRNKSLSPESKCIYAYLASFCGKESTCYPAFKTIQEELGMSENRLRKYMNELVASGVVKKIRKRNGNLLGSTVYEITHEVFIFDVSENGDFRHIENQDVDFRCIREVGTNNNNINNNISNTNKNINTVCSEPDKFAPILSGIVIPLNDGTDYDVPVSDIEKWQSVYQSVDVKQELRKMGAWSDASPTRRKTRRGVNKFINGWLSREQDRGGRFSAPREQPSVQPFRPAYYDKLGDLTPKPEDPFQ